MIQIKNLSFTNKYKLNKIIENFSITLNPGDKVCIIGEEGNGKSSLLKWIYDPKLIEDYVIYEGELIKNNDTFGYLPQELDFKDGKKTIYEFFSEDECFLNADFNELANLAIKFKLSTDIYYQDNLMGNLSGGEKIKLQLIKLLLHHFNVLLLDEPSNDIDIYTLELLENIINECEGIVIFVSHDEILLENTANMIIHIEQLKRKTTPRVNVARLDYDSYIKQRFASFEKQEQIADNQSKEKRKRDEKYNQLYQNVHNALNSVPGKDATEGRLLKKKMHAIKSMGKRFEKMDEEMVSKPDYEEAINLKFNDEAILIDKNKIVLDLQISELKIQDKILAKNIDLLIKGNDHVCIIGHNGCGKSTLIKQIYQNLKSRSDIVLGYMPQNYEDGLFLNISPIEFLASDSKKETITNVRTLLGSLKFTVKEMESEIQYLSGGQKAKILLLKMIINNCNVLILDEPTRNFSPLSNPVIREILKDFPGCIISISHDRKYIAEVCDKIYELNDYMLQEVDF